MRNVIYDMVNINVLDDHYKCSGIFSNCFNFSEFNVLRSLIMKECLFDKQGKTIANKKGINCCISLCLFILHLVLPCLSTRHSFIIKLLKTLNSEKLKQLENIPLHL